MEYYYNIPNIPVIDKNTLALINSLVNVIELRDSYTQGHSRRVALYASKIGKSLGLDETQANRLYLAGLLHDVGKIGIPDAVLLKPGKLTAEEYEIVKLHSIISAEIVANMGNFSDIVAMVRHHHEQPCGKGYPDGLTDAQIPLGAKILSVADVFDSLHSERVYRKPLALSDIQKIMWEEVQRGKLNQEITVLGFQVLSQMENPATPKNFSLPELDNKRKAFFFQDKVTGLGNRDALILLLKKASLTYIPATLVHIDIMNFRHYNKMRGLAAGDDLLVGIGLRLAQLTREQWSIELHENSTYAFRTVADSFYLLYLGYATDYAITKMNKAMTAIEQKYAVQFERMVIFEHAKIPAKIEFEIGYLL